MWTWWVRRSSKAPVSRSEPRISVHSWLLEPGFEQTAQFGEALRQLPAGQWSGLIERPRLLFEQRQIVQRIEDHSLAFIAARMPCDDLAGAGNHHFMHEALHQNLTVSVLGWYRVVVAAIANQ